ncbi:MFS transporter [Neptunicoccus sediminis]|uniref:MFS transporter n=1 Tax=Neptunicoccus sediminis TaxID=1892596 RepID=UPI0009F46582|nr:MFS transporter [Neptunicoccus sediminis]
MTHRFRFSLQSFIVITICVFLFGMGQFHRAAGAIVAPVWQDEYLLTADQLGLVISVIFIVNIVAQGFIGSLLDRVGPRRIISLFLLILAFGTLACTFTSSFTTLILARILLGLGLSVGGVGMYMLLARNFPANQFGFLNGLMVTLGGFGGLLATYPLAVGIARFGWINVFIGLSVFTAAFAAAVFLVTKKDPVDQPDQSGPAPGFLDLLKDDRVRPVLIMSCVIWAPITAITGLWGGPYYKAVHALSLEETGLFQMLFFCATMASGTAYGFIDRWGRFSRYSVILTGALTSVASLSVLALTPDMPLWAANVLLFVMIFAQQFYVPLIAQLRQVVPDAAIGRATSLYTIIAVAAIPTFQTLFGVVIQQTASLPAEQSYRLGFALMAAMVLAPTLVFAFSKAAKQP